MDDALAQQRIKEKQARKAEVLKQLEKDKNIFLSASIRNFGIEKNSTDLQQQYRKRHGSDVQEIIKNNSQFSMLHYLRCAKSIYLSFGITTYRPEDNYFIYILTHARLFGDQSRNMFRLSNEKPNTSAPVRNTRVPYKRLPNSNYMREITNLIDYLMTGYDETKYFILNANVTYIILLIVQAWSYIKDGIPLANLPTDTDSDYFNLCPYAFRNCELPKMTLCFVRLLKRSNFNIPASLVVYAFLTVKDDLTKKIMQNTCIQDMRWCNMLVPRLFFNVVSLYGVDKARLWDLLSCKKTSASLSKMAHATDEIYPYCGIISEFPISGYNNKYLCTILACIVDFKIGLDKSFYRESDWVDKDAIKAGMKIARAFHQFHVKQ